MAHSSQLSSSKRSSWPTKSYKEALCGDAACVEAHDVSSEFKVVSRGALTARLREAIATDSPAGCLVYRDVFQDERCVTVTVVCRFSAHGHGPLVSFMTPRAFRALRTALPDLVGCTHVNST